MFQGGDEVSKILWLGSIPRAPANSYFSEHTRFVGVVRNRLSAHS